MDEGEFRLEALANGEEGETDEQVLDALRDEFLTSADPNSPPWSATVGGEEIKPDALLNLGFGSDPNRPPVKIPTEEGVANKFRRIFWSIFG